MTQQKSFDMPTGRLIKEDGTYANIANILEPVPNGDETITAAEAGVKTLTPPHSNNIRAIITNPVDVRVRFGAVPAENAGTYFAKNQGVVLESAEEIAACQVYVTAAGTLFVQYYK
jgi:hypothetical protein